MNPIEHVSWKELVALTELFLFQEHSDQRKRKKAARVLFAPSGQSSEPAEQPKREQPQPTQDTAEAIGGAPTTKTLPARSHLPSWEMLAPTIEKIAPHMKLRRAILSDLSFHHPAPPARVLPERHILLVCTTNEESPLQFLECVAKALAFQFGNAHVITERALHDSWASLPKKGTFLIIEQGAEKGCLQHLLEESRSPSLVVAPWKHYFSSTSNKNELWKILKSSVSSWVASLP